MFGMQLCLLTVSLLAPNVLGIYVEEPILYGNFPDGFIWATATSAYQVEGAWNVDGRGPSIWDTFVHRNDSPIPEGGTGDEACSSYYFYEQDVELMKALGVSHYRFSISWSRIIPNGIGTVNQPGLDYYKRLLSALRDANIEPMVTLYHWDLPQALEDQGGWLNASVADWFEYYADVMFTELGDRVKLWITINEPWVVSHNGYGTGGAAPGIQQSGTADYTAAHNLLRAHAKAYRLYERKFKPTQNGRIGITLNINWAQPKDDSLESQLATERSFQFDAGWFANPIFGQGDYPQLIKDQIARKSQAQGFNQSRLPEFTPSEIEELRGSSDFFGLNYYTTNIIENYEYPAEEIGFQQDQDVRSSQDPSWYESASGWLKVTPFGMRKTLKWIQERYNDPEILITENGFSDITGDLDDLMRIYYYKYNINNVLKAIQDGVKVIGYAAWSLLDNFEWASGYTQRFGLHQVDFTSPNKTRTAKSSAEYYARIVKKNGFVKDHFCDSPAA